MCLRAYVPFCTVREQAGQIGLLRAELECDSSDLAATADRLEAADSTIAQLRREARAAAVQKAALECELQTARGRLVEAEASHAEAETRGQALLQQLLASDSATERQLHPPPVSLTVSCIRVLGVPS